MKSIAESMNNLDRDNFQRVAADMPQIQGGQDVRRQADKTAEIFNELFRQLLAVFPALASRTNEDMNEMRRQWLLAFKENGINTMEQINAGMREARKQDKPFLPGPGQFIKWCKNSGTVLGLTLVDVMGEFHRYNREKGLHTGGAERFPWSHPVMYWIVTDTRRAMYQRQLSEAETEKYAAKKLEDWALKVAAGEQIPSPVLALENNQEVIPTNHASRQRGYHPEGKSFGCMPNAASLGALTPAQWLRDEYLIGKEKGLIQ
ncbi:replication protein [Klebsiella michiganensis]|uniref:replication protein P n=1 Tax=Klebsiella michiganensis TaxID=1134687 RepID=UPI0018C4B97A|nr:replication protein P [Klebsiella michiganensis]MBG2647133.1 replication protein [Klebsiella michiganensis]